MRWKMMMRQKMDEYLDGAPDPTGRQDVENALARDPEVAALLAKMKRERALRGAVYASYTPSSQEAAGFAAQLMDACHDEALQPVGRIGHGALYWTRRIAGVAAAIMIAAGAFAAGRVTAPQTATGPSPVATGSLAERPARYSVHLADRFGYVQDLVFDNADAKDAYVSRWEQEQRRGPNAYATGPDAMI
jgi:anti-sigma factor RsiW